MAAMVCTSRAPIMHSKNKIIGLTIMLVMWGLLCQELAFIHHKHALFELSKLFWNVIDNIQETSIPMLQAATIQ